ncbi:hypothetical protein OM235_03525 [Escherichia albertii]|uniref:hypothetical protein n=1 Tax=Escherichia albertii TaxID=208962 RepID=UPI0010F63EC8|nr:hypothetical protein [Escherichia albertii]MCZ8687418.1 hypothetical protein [Escherichia albertii]MCZ8730149.1 hypothetical protein [Escherichia albertii]MCZ8882247.1 hypothetical protein [Escherichia albertii]MCZ8894761.1 hypothetical protein [Escherichia albertii]
MPYKRMENLYASYCDSVALRVVHSEREIDRLDKLVQKNALQQQDVDNRIANIWLAVCDMNLTKFIIYQHKREEALLLFDLQRLSMELQNLYDLKNDEISRCKRLIRLRTHYERKRKKWELCYQRIKVQHKLKEINKEEQLAEECSSWTV